MASKPVLKTDCRRCLVCSTRSNEGGLSVVMLSVRWFPYVPNISEVLRHDNHSPLFTWKSDISSKQGCSCRLRPGKYTRLDPKALQKGGLLFGGFNMKDE